MRNETAFIETTILVDALLKEGDKKEAAVKSLSVFRKRLLPMYAVKEFKAGPLSNFIWTHNKLVSCGSYSDTMAAIQRIATSPRKYLPATAIEALATVGTEYSRINISQLAAKYGDKADLNACLYDHARLTLKRRIALAWKRRNTIGTPVSPLNCYPNEDIDFEKEGIIEVKSTACKSSCSIASEHRSSADIRKLENAIPESSARAEDKKRRAALQDIRCGNDIQNQVCRNLGDAVFALQCPPDAKVLTTNDRDHRPLAEALGKEVITPAEVIASL